MKKKLCVLLLLTLCALTLFGSIPAQAIDSYQTYTYSINGEARYSPAAYKALTKVDSSTFESGSSVTLKNAADICTDKEGNVYISDKDNNRVIVLDSHYNMVASISGFYVNGNSDSLSGPRGLFANDEYLFVCDSGQQRVVIFDRRTYEYVNIINKPTDDLFEDTDTFIPIAIAVDQYDRIFLVSEGLSKGVIVMGIDGSFTGFIGAPKVSYSLFDIIWRRFQSAEDRATSAQLVSVPFNNITLDETETFIYVTTNSLESSKQISNMTSKSPDNSPVRKLNAAGSEIMKRNGFFDPSGEVNVNDSTVKQDDVIQGASSIIDVAVGEEGTWSIIDSKRNKVFTYDQNGELLFAFGDAGTQLGNTASVRAIAYQGGKMLLLDSTGTEASITVYQRTEYGELIMEALAAENAMEYDRAAEAWERVLQHNNNFDAAYIGLGRAELRKASTAMSTEESHECYVKAMDYFKAAYDTENYSTAFKEIRRLWVSKYFIVIPIVIIVVGFLWFRFKKYVARVNQRAVLKVGRKKYYEELLYAFHLMYHPFDGFWDLKHEQRGSVRGATTILGLVILCFYYQSIGYSYIMNPEGTYTSFLMQVLSILIPLILFVVSNWCLTTLFDGEGSFRDIYVSTCYALSPLPVLLIVSTLLSNIVSADEAAIVTLLVSIGFVWAGLLIFFGMMVTHDYSMGKNLLTILGTIIAMAIILFVVVLFSSLIGKMVSFISTIVTELSFRV